MGVPLEQFVRQLEDSGILAAETLNDFIAPKSSPKDGDELARELVRHKMLTKFQAEEVYRGKGNSLVLGNYLTVDYMAPEQALNTKTADARADIYSLGCSLFYLLTGSATYEGDTLMAKLLAHRDQPIPALRMFRPEAPELVEAVFTR